MPDDSLEGQDKSMQEKGNSKDDNIKRESPLEQGTDDCSGSEPNLEGENHEKSIDDNEILRNGNYTCYRHSLTNHQQETKLQLLIFQITKRSKERELQRNL